MAMPVLINTLAGTTIDEEQHAEECVDSFDAEKPFGLRVGAGMSSNMAADEVVMGELHGEENSNSNSTPSKIVVQEARPPVSAVPERLAGSRETARRQLRKFASETSFGAAPALAMQMVGASAGTGSAGSSGSGALSVVTNDEYTYTPTNANESREIRTPSRIFHVRPVPSSSRGSNGFASANAVINKLNNHRRRQDSDDASGSVASENTVASGTMTPISRRHMRFKMRRPKSTGNMGYHPISGTITGIAGPGPISNERETTNSGGTGVYDASYTSATIHSLDSSGHANHMATPSMDERRPSNFYMMDDDSTHEFDEEEGDTASNRRIDELAVVGEGASSCRFVHNGSA
uniref:Similar to n=1 Tax=Panagrellus redivivus TaxID=6233 RepID=A0A7E4W6D6_PANRE